MASIGSDAETANGNAYTGLAKGFHWLLAILVLLMLYGGLALADQKPPEIGQSLIKHSGIGLVILALMAGRLAWRLTHPAPPLPADMPRWQQRAAHGAHHALYLSLFLQPLFGLLMATTSKHHLRPFDLFDLHVSQVDTLNAIGHYGHGINAWILIALIGGHIAAALYHQFVRRDNVLRRMLPFVSARAD